MNLFEDGKLLKMFGNRNIYGFSEGKINVRKEFIFSVLVDFGINGKLARHSITSIDFNNISESWSKVDVHTKGVLDIVGALDDFLQWLEKDRSSTFNKLVCPAKPVVVHGHRSDKKTLFAIYGEGMFDLQFIVTAKDRAFKQNLAKKVQEIRDVLQDHVFAINNLRVKEIVTKINTPGML